MKKAEDFLKRIWSAETDPVGRNLALILIPAALLMTFFTWSWKAGGSYFQMIINSTGLLHLFLLEIPALLLLVTSVLGVLSARRGIKSGVLLFMLTARLAFDCALCQVGWDSLHPAAWLYLLFSFLALLSMLIPSRKAAEDNKTKEPASWICPVCGAVVRVGTAFCPSCGTSADFLPAGSGLDRPKEAQRQ